MTPYGSPLAAFVTAASQLPCHACLGKGAATLPRGGEAASRLAHNQETAGSIPARATLRSNYAYR